MVVYAAHPIATSAGAEALRRGGTAADAAVVVETVLSLVEPQSSGIGGGGFALYWDAATEQLTTYDGRETAPASTRPDQFLTADGKPMPFRQRVLGGQSVGVPGVMPMLADLHAAHGRLSWEELLKPAEEIATDGFEISPRLSLVASYMTSLKAQPATHDYFYGGGDKALPAGTHITNKAYAQTMRALAENPRALNEGAIANAIAQTALDARTGQPNLTLEDLASFEPTERAPVCSTYREYKVCGMGPPSSGGIAVLQILGLLERFDVASLSARDPELWHLFAEAQRLAYADRGYYLGDPDFVSIPISELISKAYLAERSALIDPAKAAGTRMHGTPANVGEVSLAPQWDQSAPSTTHFSIVDGYGNIVSMTASIEGPFGSHIMVEGFLLNNELTDFSAIPEIDGRPVANAPGPGRRPLSSMSPTVVFDKTGSPLLVIGSPGGRNIIAYTAKTIVGVLDLGLSIEDAIALPNVINTNGDTKVEDNPKGQVIAEALRDRGHTVKLSTRLTSGLNGVWLGEDEPVGGADKRREGTVQTGTASRNRQLFRFSLPW